MSIRWNSPEFWAAYCGDFAAINACGDPVGFHRRRQRPTAGGCSWDGWLSFYLFDIIDLPPADHWRESLIERPYDWREPDESTPIDAKVWVRQGIEWTRRHYAGIGKFYTSGYTSWTSTSIYSAYDLMVLADPAKPDRVPPADWKPKEKEQ